MVRGRLVFEISYFECGNFLLREILFASGVQYDCRFCIFQDRIDGLYSVWFTIIMCVVIIDVLTEVGKEFRSEIAEAVYFLVLILLEMS